MRDLLLFAILMGLIPVILFRPWVGILAWFWIGLMSPHNLTWGFMQTFPIATLIAGLTLLALVISHDRRSPPMTREMIMMWVFAIFMAITSYFAVNSAAAWEFYIHLMKILLITFLTPVLIFGQKRIILLLLTITLSISFFGFKGGLFAIGTGGAYMVMGPPRSYLEGNTYIGLAMIMVLPLLLVSARMFHRQWAGLEFSWVKQYSKPIGWGLYGVFWLTCIAILATHSRGALVGILAVAPFLILHMKGKLFMGMAVFIAVVVVGVTAPEPLAERWRTIQNYEEDQSAMQRIQSWGVNLNMAIESPLTGKGFRHTYSGYDWWVSYANFEGPWRHVLSAHSIYFGILGEHGFVGLIIFLLLVGFTFSTLGRIRRTARRETGQIWLAEYAWAIQVGLIGYLVAGAFLDVAYFNLFYAFVALAIIMRRELEEAPHVNALEEGSGGGSHARTGDAGLRFPDFVAPTPIRRNEI